MNKLKIYLDNCCHCRPFDDLAQEKIRNESNAKMFIQSLIKFNSLALCSSFMSLYEANEIPTAGTKEHILKFISDYSAYFVGDKRKDDVKTLSGEVMETGIKKKDATHLACAIFAECDYFITTDKRVTNYATDKIKIVNPIDFIKIWREM